MPGRSYASRIGFAEVPRLIMVHPDSITLAKRIQRSTGRTFHLTTRVLPERVRHPTYVLYGFFRLADQVVDDTDPLPPTEQAALLTEYEQSALGNRETNHPVLNAMADLVDRHAIDEREITEFIDAMRADIEPTPFARYRDLEEYLRGSAVAVAYMMLKVMNPPQLEAARPHARALGEAFQLTNFLRDVREDSLQYDRLYLPLETLKAHGVSPEEIHSLRFSEGVARVIETELDRTEDRYRVGVEGIKYLPADCRFAVLLAAVFYAEYHRMIASQGYDVLTKQPSFTRRRYAVLFIRTWFAWKRHDDPATVFYRVSPIDPPTEGAHQDTTSSGLTSVIKEHILPSSSD